MKDNVSDIMKSPVVTVHPEMTLHEVIKLMRSHSIGSVLVVDKDMLCGIFTDKDAIACFNNAPIENLVKPISKFMTKNPITIQQNDSQSAAAVLMKQHGIRHLPVYDGGKLTGIISIRDLVNYTEAPVKIPLPDNTAVPKAKELTGFQMRNINILTYLLMKDAVSDEIVEYLRESELDYFSLIEKTRYLQERVNIDEKTGLLKYKSDYLLNILKTASRILSGIVKNYPVCLIRFDIDDFSIFNNKYGHDTGDKVLVTFSRFLKGHSRPSDYIIRFGGEEFDVILPNTRKEGLLVYLKKLYADIDHLTVDAGENRIGVTVSAGASVLIYDLNKKKIRDQEIQSLFTRIQNEADDALYDSKYSGKNRFSLYEAKKADKYPGIREQYSLRKK
jgi:diguanylate cyclase (GGDEF)-like protein